MTIQKAINVLDYFLQGKKGQKQNLLDFEKKLDQGVVLDLSRVLDQNINDEILLIKTILNQLIIKCRHPKKFHDLDPERNRYCTICNQNL